MSKRSHIDVNKLDKVPKGHTFEYNDIVREDFPIVARTEDGKKFRAEVESGLYYGLEVKEGSGGNCVVYQKR